MMAKTLSGLWRTSGSISVFTPQSPGKALKLRLKDQLRLNARLRTVLLKGRSVHGSHRRFKIGLSKRTSFRSAFPQDPWLRLA